MRGKTQLFRRNMTLEDLKKILDDPRTHTRKGYHRIPNSGTKYNEDRVLANPSSIFQFQDEDTLDFLKISTKKASTPFPWGMIASSFSTRMERQPGVQACLDISTIS